MSFLDKLPQLFETKPLVLLRFADGFEHRLSEAKEGKDRFTVVKPHGAFEGIRVPTLCLAEMPEAESGKCFVGVLRSKTSVGTFDSRITVLKLQPLKLPSFQTLASMLGAQFQNAINEKLATGAFALPLSPKLSAGIIASLASNSADGAAIEFAASNLSQLQQRPNTEWEQLESIRTSMAAFGLKKSDSPKLVDVPVGSDSTLIHLMAREQPRNVHILEDNVIAKDAGEVPGFERIRSYLTGRATFLRGDESLVVYTANRGPLESMLGVDLIYVNETVGNIVMVQYKMLERYVNPATVKTDWIFRPDGQLEAQMSRMRLPAPAEKLDDYRLQRSPFYFKFVKREGDGETHESFIISLDHLKLLLLSAKGKGPKEGVRVSYEALERVYLREYDLINLIRSGYIGTHRIESEALMPIMQAVSEGDRGLVLSWQRRVQGEAHPTPP